ncbi:uncharacterized protein C8A04DRAFT_25890 [Dichotomopilus funicola]|uniref:Synaptobrevin n=1 Tax=Dichotomopilus funicola TaxID=1934379 RepID=A0AAN6V7T8_9PEZI|nr:hypothetical protein C8A04DRAFT_25890 [Dichotomopilus funicola]
MARLIHGVTATPVPRRGADPQTDLTLLLTRLQRTILHADAEREARLRDSEFERDKARANVQYARSLLTKLEQEALTVKIHARRQDIQTDLVQKQEILDQLSERLSDLAEFAAAGRSRSGRSFEEGNKDGRDDDDDTSDGEDILADIIATPSESLESTQSADAPQESRGEPQTSHPPPQPQPQLDDKTDDPPNREPQQEQTTVTSQTLRPRHTPHAQSQSQNPPESQSHSPSQSHPHPPPTRASTTSSLLNTTQPTPPTTSPTSPPTTTTRSPTTAISTTEAILDHQRAEQDALSSSILRLASELKQSSHAFSASLEEDRELVDRAGRGLSKTGQDMEGVTRKMGMLTRMTEGEGWWGRLRLYGFIYGLMVVLVLVVFVLPKLRF